MGYSFLPRLNGQTFEHSIRTAIAATASFLVARLFGLPEAYWASVTTIVVTESTLGAALKVSEMREAGTVLGALAGAILAKWFGPSALVFACGVFVLGLICASLRLDRSAYRFAGITLAIVMLIARAEPPWVVALHRFFEVSLGIVVGLAMAAVWPERQMTTPSPAVAPKG